MLDAHAKFARIGISPGDAARVIARVVDKCIALGRGLPFFVVGRCLHDSTRVRVLIVKHTSGTVVNLMSEFEKEAECDWEMEL